MSTFFHNESHSFEMVTNFLKTIPPENYPESQFVTPNHFHLMFYPGPTKIFFSRGVPLDDLVIIEGFIRPSCCPHVSSIQAPVSSHLGRWCSVEKCPTSSPRKFALVLDEGQFLDNFRGHFGKQSPLKGD